MTCRCWTRNSTNLGRALPVFSVVPIPTLIAALLSLLSVVLTATSKKVEVPCHDRLVGKLWDHLCVVQITHNVVPRAEVPVRS